MLMIHQKNLYSVFSSHDYNFNTFFDRFWPFIMTSMSTYEDFNSHIDCWIFGIVSILVKLKKKRKK